MVRPRFMIPMSYRFTWKDECIFVYMIMEYVPLFVICKLLAVKTGQSRWMILQIFWQSMQFVSVTNLFFDGLFCVLFAHRAYKKIVWLINQFSHDANEVHTERSHLFTHNKVHKEPSFALFSIMVQNFFPPQNYFSNRNSKVYIISTMQLSELPCILLP